MFAGFPEETIRFFLDVRYHNEPTFYKEHQDEYNAFVREPFFALIDDVASVMPTVAPDLELRPQKCLARLRRDTRFTKDKSPYRDHLWFVFHRAVESKETSVMYWFELGPEWVTWGLGFWGMNRPAMDALRRRIAEKPKEVARALKQSRVPDENMQLLGERYQRMKPPPGLPLELAMLYPSKDVYIKRVNVPMALCYQPALAQAVKEDFLRLKPLYTLLRSAADEAMARLDP